MTSLLLAAGPHTQPLIGHTRAVLGPAVGKTDGQNNKRGETLISVSSITLIGEYAKFQILPKREKILFLINIDYFYNITNVNFYVKVITFIQIS